MLRRIGCAFLLAGVSLLVCGCTASDWSWPSGSPSSPTRTITATGGPDTELARRENESGLAFLAKGDLDNARDAFLKAIDADPEFAPAQNNLGKVFLKQGDLHEAARRFDEARRLMPDHAGPCNNLGLVYEEAWRRKMSLSRGTPATENTRRELNRAIELYRQAIGLDADAIEYKANLVRALIHRGDRTDEVRLLLKQVIKTDTRPPWLTWARRELATMGRGPE